MVVRHGITRLVDKHRLHRKLLVTAPGVEFDVTLGIIWDKRAVDAGRHILHLLAARGLIADTCPVGHLLVLIPELLMRIVGLASILHPAGVIDSTLGARVGESFLDKACDVHLRVLTQVEMTLAGIAQE